MSNKTLIVYMGDSYYKYHRLYSEHIFSVNESSHLCIYKRNPHTGKEREVARFRTWDYFLVESDIDF